MGSERQKPLRVEQFTTARNAQPWWYRATNRVGRVLPSFGTPSAEAWFEKAKRKNRGVGDPRPETLAALKALLHSVREDAQLSFSGRIAAQMDCLRMAGQHLLIEQAIRETPEILDAQIPPPIFLIGWMRTGTTFVHRLLAQDPDTRTMPYWESMYPVPPKTGKDGRAEELAHVLKQLEAISPNYEAIHPMGAHEPEECVALFTNVFRTLQYNVQYRVPSYVEWLQGQDPRVAYGQYRQQLQLVQFHRPHGIRFALKDPTHSVFLDTILELFPNARFVFTHRDPATTMSSLCSLYAYARWPAPIATSGWSSASRPARRCTRCWMRRAASPGTSTFTALKVSGSAPRGFEIVYRATANASIYEASGLLLNLALAAPNTWRILTPAQMNRINSTIKITMLTQGTYT